MCRVRSGGGVRVGDGEDHVKKLFFFFLRHHTYEHSRTEAYPSVGLLWRQTSQSHAPCVRATGWKNTVDPPLPPLDERPP